MGTLCLLLQFLHHKLNAACLAKKMNKLTALQRKMQVTGKYKNGSEMISMKEGDLVRSLLPGFQTGSGGLGDMVYSLCKHHLLKTAWVLRFDPGAPMKHKLK